ncbi:DUF4192 domain-containing protein [Actinokineospora guangxiensis]|uniref:DUF4192 domain-containing protein n=1 Tax=Actinokineospora guangxiensis TaxID=1490288 RepID=A0ABW0ENX7_9PSEU
MTTALDATLPLDGGDLIAAIPHLLGFHPKDSLVLITLVDTESPHIGAVLRLDLPPERHRAQMAGHVARLAAGHGAASAVAVVVGGGGSPQALPHRRFVADLARTFRRSSVSLDHAIWVAEVERDIHWRCYDHRGCAGQVPDPDTSPFGVGMLVRGAVKYASREALAATLAPDPQDALDRRELLIDTRADADPPTRSTVDAALAAFTTDPPDDDPIDAYDDMVLDMFHVHAPPADNLPTLPDETLADLAVALYDSEIRGHCQQLALTPQAPAAERLWTYLVRALPPPDRAEPACFLAVSAYLRGNGSLARVALDIALQSRPAHTLASLLTAALDGAMTPRELRTILTQAGET